MSGLQPARVLEVEPDAYHKLPLFSATVARRIVQQSALHAFDAWERKLVDDVDENLSEDQQKARERGSLYHHMVLGKGKRIVVIPREVLAKNGSYGTDESKAMRDAARAAGHIPVKEPDMGAHEKVASAIKARIQRAGHELDGRSEFAVEWSELTPDGEVRCKGMFDHTVIWGIPGWDDAMSDPVASGAVIYDLKIVEDAHPDKCERSAAYLGLAIQAAAYIRALAALHPRLAGRTEFRFLFCEARRPYDLWDPRASNHFLQIGEQQWLRAVRAWAAGHAGKGWPGHRHKNRTEIEPTVWLQQQEGMATDEL